MKNPLLCVCLGLALAAVPGCAATLHSAPADPATGASAPESGVASADLAVAGWRVPFECLELARRIESSQSRLYDAGVDLLSTERATDERRLRSLESRADELGCLVPGTPHSY